MALLIAESALLAAAGLLGGVMLLYIGNGVAAPFIESRFGIHLSWRMLSLREWMMLAGVFAAALASAVVPGLRAYRYSLSDGLSMKI